MQFVVVTNARPAGRHKGVNAMAKVLVLPNTLALPPVKFRAKTEGRYGKRRVAGRMNVTESEYADLLEKRRIAGEVRAWWFEPMSIRLGDGCHFCPDFLVLLADLSLECVDTKGAGPLDAKGQVKLKVAAELMWPFKFVQEKRRKKKDGGGWIRREF